MELLLARILLAGIFGVAGITKLAERRGIGTAMAQFGLPARIASPLGWLLAVCELGVALALVVPTTAPAGAVGAAGLLLVFSAAIAGNLARGRRPTCHCFGQLHSAPIGWWMVARNGLLASIAGFVAADGRYPLLFLGLAAIAAGVWVALRLDQAMRMRAGRVAPSFSLPDLTGRTWTLEALLGPQKPLALIFSNPDCPGCTAMLPDVAAWQTALDGRLTVALVSGGSRQDNLAKADEYGLGRVLVDERQALFAAYGVTATPAAVLVAGDGRMSAGPAFGAGDIAGLIATAMGHPTEPVYERRELFGRAARAVAGAAALLFFAPASGAVRGLLGAAIGLGEAEAAQQSGPQPLCNQAFALCTAAPCVQSQTDPNILLCRCIVQQSGYSVGYKTCAERAPSGDTLHSNYSLQNVTSQTRAITCNGGIAGNLWANCLDVECQIDPANPSQALCQCVKAESASFVTFSTSCDPSICMTAIWSAADPALIGGSTQQYINQMQAAGQTVTMPTNCPAPKST